MLVENFYGRTNRNPAPLTARLKYQLAYRGLIYPVTMAGFVLNAGFFKWLTILAITPV
jgi:hypothetical protein